MRNYEGEILSHYHIKLNEPFLARIPNINFRSDEFGSTITFKNYHCNIVSFDDEEGLLTLKAIDLV